MFRRRQVPLLCPRHIAGHSHRDRNQRRVSGTAVGKGPEISHVGLSGRRRAFLVSPFPDGLEEGVRSPAAELESVTKWWSFCVARQLLCEWVHTRACPRVRGLSGTL